MSYEMMLKGAGVGINLLGTYLSNQATRYGAQLQQGEIEIAMQQNTLASTQQAVVNQQRLNDTLSMQRAVAGARGQQIGQGSQLSAQTHSQIEHQRDEENRQLNLQSAAAKAKLQKSAIGLNSKNKQQQRWTNFASTEFQGTSLNSLIGDYLNPAKGGF